jgi:GIY-YIG catalytic domain
MDNYVYWIYDETTIDPSNSGYIGVSKNPNRRFKTHLRKKRVHENCNMKILFNGTRKECFIYERKMRPQKNIGWNNAVGGSHGWREGFTHSEEIRQLMKSRWTEERKKNAAILMSSRAHGFKGQKRPKQSIAMSGNKNPMYGTKRPPHVIEAIKRTHSGKPAINRQENYCIGCRQRVSQSRLLRSHKTCFDNFGKIYG